MAGILAAGSRVRVGFLLNTEHFSTDYENVILPDLEGCLYDTGQFSSIEFFLEKGSVFSRDTLIVVAITAADFTKAEDFGGLVAETIKLCAPDVYISERKPVMIDDAPDAVKGNPAYQQINNQEGQGPSRQPGQCDNLSFFEYLSCESGISSTGIKAGGTALLIGGAILLVVLLRR